MPEADKTIPFPPELMATLGIAPTPDPNARVSDITPAKANLYTLKQMIQGGTRIEQASINKLAKQFRALLAENPSTGHIALALVGLESQVLAEASE